MNRDLRRPHTIYLYDEGTAPTLDAPALADYLSRLTACPNLTTRGPFLLHHPAPEDLPARLARLKVRDLSSPLTNSGPTDTEPAPVEIDFERRRLANHDRGPFGILYDGFAFQALLRDLLPPAELRLDHLHLVFTNRTIATWDPDDLRYHLRTILLGLPAIISTTGLAEAPAKPPEFYLTRQQLALTTRPELADAAAREKFKDHLLHHDDPRLTEVAKGYAMQALLYQLTGEAFCDNPDCRLFNAHWQAELLRAQLAGPPEYCPRHESLLADLRTRA